MSINIASENVHFDGHTASPPAPAAVPISTGAACLVSSADRCSVSSVRACVSVRRVLYGLPCIWHGLRCVVRPGALGAGVSTGGVYRERRGWGRSCPLIPKQIKKTFSVPTHPLFSAKTTPPPLQSPQNFPQKQKDPYKGSVFCAILALQALKGRNLQWLKVK